MIDKFTLLASDTISETPSTMIISMCSPSPPNHADSLNILHQVDKLSQLSIRNESFDPITARSLSQRSSYRHRRVSTEIARNLESPCHRRQSTHVIGNDWDTLYSHDQDQQCPQPMLPSFLLHDRRILPSNASLRNSEIGGKRTGSLADMVRVDSSSLPISLWNKQESHNFSQSEHIILQLNHVSQSTLLETQNKVQQQHILPSHVQPQPQIMTKVSVPIQQSQQDLQHFPSFSSHSSALNILSHTNYGENVTQDESIHETSSHLIAVSNSNNSISTAINGMLSYNLTNAMALQTSYNPVNVYKQCAKDKTTPDMNFSSHTNEIFNNSISRSNPTIMLPRAVVNNTPIKKNQMGGRVPATKHDDRKLFVGGLPNEVTDATFLRFFEQYGPVIDSVVLLDRRTKRSRGFGFVTFRDEDVARSFLNVIPGHTGRIKMHGKICEIKASEPKTVEADQYAHSSVSAYHMSMHPATAGAAWVLKEQRMVNGCSKHSFHQNIPCSRMQQHNITYGLEPDGGAVSIHPHLSISPTTSASMPNPDGTSNVDGSVQPTVIIQNNYYTLPPGSEIPLNRNPKGTVLVSSGIGALVGFRDEENFQQLYQQAPQQQLYQHVFIEQGESIGTFASMGSSVWEPSYPGNIGTEDCVSIGNQQRQLHKEQSVNHGYQGARM